MKTRLLETLYDDFGRAEGVLGTVPPSVSLDLTDASNKLVLRLHETDITKLEELVITAVPQEGGRIVYTAWKELVERRFSTKKGYFSPMPKVVREISGKYSDYALKQIFAEAQTPKKTEPCVKQKELLVLEVNNQSHYHVRACFKWFLNDFLRG